MQCMTFEGEETECYIAHAAIQDTRGPEKMALREVIILVTLKINICNSHLS